MAENGTPNGASRYQTDKVRVAIIGVGNCASAFVQGVEYYKNADPRERVPGLMHVDVGGYHISDIEFTAAFDIDADKVGKDLSKAIWSGQNNTIKFAEVAPTGVTVSRGMTLDGIGKYLSEVVEKDEGSTDDVVKRTLVGPIHPATATAYDIPADAGEVTVPPGTDDEVAKAEAFISRALGGKDAQTADSGVGNE